ncbi:Uncharacterised protein [Mycobacteroides abscessus subsp. abscessus]|nr:Uncharacterised protein [Mycobacteroides abscessus subsp. abscessus]
MSSSPLPPKAFRAEPSNSGPPNRQRASAIPCSTRPSKHSGPLTRSWADAMTLRPAPDWCAQRSPTGRPCPWRTMTIPTAGRPMSTRCYGNASRPIAVRK